MAIDSVMQKGLAGMQASQRQITTAADQVARVGMRPPAVIGMTPTPETVAPDDSRAAVTDQNGVEPLIEMRRQEQIFTASAKLVSIADNTLGSLIDVTS